MTAPARPAIATALAAASLALCVVSLWTAWIGVLVNLAILAATYPWRRP